MKDYDTGVWSVCDDPSDISPASSMDLEPGQKKQTKADEHHHTQQSLPQADALMAKVQEEMAERRRQLEIAFVVAERLQAALDKDPTNKKKQEAVNQAVQRLR